MGDRLVVLVGNCITHRQLVWLREEFPRVEIVQCSSEDELVARAHRARIIFSKRIPAQAIERAKDLRWVQAGTAGVGHLLDLGLRERDVLLTNAVGAHGVPIAELTISMMLAFVTGLHDLIRAQRDRERIAPRIIATKQELAGQTLCILGLGDIGGTLARKTKALGMRVLGVRRSETPFPGIDVQYTPDQLSHVLPKVDHLVLALPLTTGTIGIVGENELRAIKPSAYVYNVGRGKCIDGRALLRALEENWIAGAGLDVTDPEPVPRDSPLWRLPNVILSQHTSGSSPLNAERITAIFARNLRHYLDGEKMDNVVDKALGY